MSTRTRSGPGTFRFKDAQASSRPSRCLQLLTYLRKQLCLRRDFLPAGDSGRVSRLPSSSCGAQPAAFWFLPFSQLLWTPFLFLA